MRCGELKWEAHLTMISGNLRHLNDLLSDREVRYGESISYRGLFLIPAFTQRRAPFDYVPLAQATGAGTVSIEEVGGGTVPTLRVVNKGDRPVLLVDGEHLVGVKQNRVLNTTILVPEKSSLDIPVSCVEEGRWSAPRYTAKPDSPHLFAKARARKAETVMMSVRTSGRFMADQRAVWEDVAERLRDLGGHSPSMALDALYNQKRDDLSGYVRHLPWQPGQTGVIAATGGRIICCDLFDRPETLEVLWDRLVSSYAVEAMVIQSEMKLTADEGKAFLWEATQAVVTSHPAVGRGTDLRLTSNRIVGAALEVDDTILHLAIFRREGDHRTGGGFESPRVRRQSRPNTIID
jgi:hypothetical protein